MPHFGLMDEFNMPPDEAALLRARLHLRGGKRRLRQGKLRAGVVTLFDALYYAMRWYVLSAGRDGRQIGGYDISDERSLYAALVREGVLDGGFDFGGLCSLTDKALDKELPELDTGYDCTDIIAAIDSAMTMLGVMPLDEGSLPPEDPSTF